MRKQPQRATFNMLDVCELIKNCIKNAKKTTGKTLTDKGAIVLIIEGQQISCAAYPNLKEGVSKQITAEAVTGHEHHGAKKVIFLTAMLRKLFKLLDGPTMIAIEAEEDEWAIVIQGESFRYRLIGMALPENLKEQVLCSIDVPQLTQPAKQKTLEAVKALYQHYVVNGLEATIEAFSRNREYILRACRAYADIYLKSKIVRDLVDSGRLSYAAVHKLAGHNPEKTGLEFIENKALTIARA